MAYTVANIMTGAFDLYVLAYTATNDPVTGNVVDWTGWTQLGFQSEDGVVLRYSAEWFEIKVHKYNAPIKRELIGESLAVGLTLMESDLQQLRFAIAASTYTAGAVAGTNPNKLEIGDKAAVSNYSVGCEGVAVTGEELILFVPKVDRMGEAEIPLRKGAVRTVPIEFGALADPNEAAGSTLATIYEITAA